MADLLIFLLMPLPPPPPPCGITTCRCNIVTMEQSTYVMLRLDTGDADFIVIKPPTVCFTSGPVSEKPDEGLFFVDKDTEESPVTGMFNTQYLLVHTLHFVFIKMKFCSIRQMNVCWQDQGRTLSFTLFFTHLLVSATMGNFYDGHGKRF